MAARTLNSYTPNAMRIDSLAEKNGFRKCRSVEFITI